VFGMRCADCGEVRWSILGRAVEGRSECPACGGAMIEERRHPGRLRWSKDERRDATLPSAPPRIKLG